MQRQGMSPLRHAARAIHSGVSALRARHPFRADLALAGNRGGGARHTAWDSRRWPGSGSPDHGGRTPAARCPTRSSRSHRRRRGGWRPCSTRRKRPTVRRSRARVDTGRPPGTRPSNMPDRSGVEINAHPPDPNALDGLGPGEKRRSALDALLRRGLADSLRERPPRTVQVFVGRAFFRQPRQFRDPLMKALDLAWADERGQSAHLRAVVGHLPPGRVCPGHLQVRQVVLRVAVGRAAIPSPAPHTSASASPPWARLPPGSTSGPDSG